MKKYLLTLSSLALAFGVTHAADSAIAVTDVADPFANMTLDAAETQVSSLSGGFPVAASPAIGAVPDIFAAANAAAAGVPEVKLAEERDASLELPTGATTHAAEDDAGMAREMTEIVGEVEPAEEGAVDESESNAEVLAPPAAVEINTAEESATTHAEEDAGMAREMTEIVGGVEPAEESVESADAGTAATAPTAEGSDADGVAGGDESSDEREDVVDATDGSELPNSN